MSAKHDFNVVIDLSSIIRFYEKISALDIRMAVVFPYDGYRVKKPESNLPTGA
jgi:hypothetical protein